jgi:hypothetical protein
LVRREFGVTERFGCGEDPIQRLADLVEARTSVRNQLALYVLDGTCENEQIVT